jgi:hypothetical protein
MKACVFSGLKRDLIAGMSIKKIIGRPRGEEGARQSSEEDPARISRQPLILLIANTFFITFHVRPRRAVVK